MWKIAVVMLVTAVFAGLLIYTPYGPSSESAARPINVPPRLANEVPALSGPETIPTAESPPRIKPEDVEAIVLKVLADRVAPQEKEYKGSSEVAGALPGKSVATIAPRPLLASNGSQERPVAQTAARPPIVQAISARHEDPPVSRPDDAIDIGGMCPSGIVIGLDPNGDNFLSVRSGPGGQPYHEIDRLFSSNAVHVCGRKASWLAVVYSPARKTQDSCDIASKGTPRPYDGPCRSGWVHSRYIKMTAAD